MILYLGLIMTSGRWESVHQQHYAKEEQTVKEQPTATELFHEYFAKNLFAHLTKPTEPQNNSSEQKKEKNQPGVILDTTSKPQSSLGLLSRIFDAFYYPVTPYAELKKINDEGRLRSFMNEHLDSIAPILLNESRTALNGEVIETIGVDRYKAILANAAEAEPEREVALQFVKAVFVSYGQRVIDSLESEPDDLKVEAYASLNSSFEILGGQVTLKGLPEKELHSKSDLEKILIHFKELLDNALDAKLDIPNIDIRRIQTIVDEAQVWLDMDNTEKAIASYDEAVDRIISAAPALTVDQPKEANWFVQMLRFITNNEKLLQNSDEQRYERQMELLPKLNNLSQTLNSLIQEPGEAPEPEAELNTTIRND